MLIESTLTQAFRAESWQTLLTDLFPNELLDLLPTPESIASTQDFISEVQQLGRITLGEDTILLLTVETGDSVYLPRNCVGLRSFLTPFLDDPDFDAVLAVFHQPESPNWRITYASRSYTFDQDGQLKKEETAPKRFTFLAGKNEPPRTTAEGLKSIQLKGEELTLSDVEKAFSVQRVSKNFFDDYLAHYEAFVDELLSDERATETRSLSSTFPPRQMK